LLGKLRLQLRGKQLALAPLAVVIDDMGQCEDGAVKEDVVVQLGQEKVDHDFGRDAGFGDFPSDELRCQCRQAGRDEPTTQASSDVNQQTPRPTPLAERKPPGQP
jgi:hypothetical protein